MRLYYSDTYIIQLLELCYTETMIAKHKKASAPAWLDLLRGVYEGVAPLAVVGAQLLYIGAPFLRLFWSQEQIYRLAEKLEEAPGSQEKEA